MKYAHYNKETNEILGYYDDTIHEQIPEPNLKISDEAWSEALKINANRVDIKNKTLFYKEKEISFDELKTQKIKEFHQKRDEESIAEYEFEGHTYRMGLDVQQDILSTLTIFDKDNFIPGYTLKDIVSGEYAPFTYEKLQELSRAVAIRKATLVFKTQKLEDAINACENKEQLENIKFS